MIKMFISNNNLHRLIFFFHLENTVSGRSYSDRPVCNFYISTKIQTVPPSLTKPIFPSRTCEPAEDGRVASPKRNVFMATE